MEKKLESHLAVCHSTLRRKQTLILWKKQKAILILSFNFWVDAFILRVYFVESALFHICVFDWGKQKMLLWAFLTISGLQWTLHFAHPQGHWGWIIFNVFLKIVYLHKNCHLIYCVVCEKRKDPLTIYQRHFYSSNTVWVCTEIYNGFGDHYSGFDMLQAFFCHKIVWLHYWYFYIIYIYHEKVGRQMIVSKNDYLSIGIFISFYNCTLFFVVHIQCK